MADDGGEGLTWRVVNTEDERREMAQWLSRLCSRPDTQLRAALIAWVDLLNEEDEPEEPEGLFEIIERVRVEIVQGTLDRHQDKVQDTAVALKTSRYTVFRIVNQVGSQTSLNRRPRRGKHGSDRE